MSILRLLRIAHKIEIQWLIIVLSFKIILILIQTNKLIKYVQTKRFFKKIFVSYLLITFLNL